MHGQIKRYQSLVLVFGKVGEFCREEKATIFRVLESAVGPRRWGLDSGQVWCGLQKWSDGTIGLVKVGKEQQRLHANRAHCTTSTRKEQIRARGACRRSLLQAHRMGVGRSGINTERTGGRGKCTRRRGRGVDVHSQYGLIDVIHTTWCPSSYLCHQRIVHDSNCQRHD